MTVRFSANLGFLWTDRPLPAAIRAAGAAGFDAVECHMPYDVAAADVRAALASSGLAMVSLNTRMGDPAGDIGVAAIPGLEALARAQVDEALDYAVEIDCASISVLAGRSRRAEGAEPTYQENLAYAADRAAAVGRTVLIEPMNSGVADYHLTRVDQGLETIAAVGAPNLKLMIDCFHSQMMEGDLWTVFRRAIDHVGHVQFAAVPDRGEPDRGDVDYAQLLPAIVALGYEGTFGAEYNPRGSIEDGLGWLERWRSQRTKAHGETE